MVRCAWLVLLLACRATPPAASFEAPSEAVVTASSQNVLPSRPALTGKEVMVVQRDGMKLGHGIVEWTPTPSGGLVETLTTVFELQANGVSVRVESVSTTKYDEELRTIEFHNTKREADATSETHVRVEGSRVFVHEVEPSHEEKRELETPADFGSELAVFHRLRSEAIGGKALPLEFSFKVLDDDDRGFEPRTFTLKGRETVEGREGWRFESLDGERLTTGVLDDRGMPILLELSGLLVAREGLQIAKTRGLADFSSELPLEGKLAPASSRAVHVFLEGDAPTSPAIFKENAYQRVSREEGRYVLELSAMKAKLSKSPRLPLTELAPEVQRFLGATAMSQSEAKEIVDLSAKLVAGQKDSRKAARAIAQWVYENLEKTDGVRGAASAVETLEAKRGDCTEHTALVVALARAAGIPARAVGGIVLYTEDAKPGAGYHAWPELWLGEWVVLDAAIGSFDVSANYIFLEYDEPGEPSSDGIVRLLGKTRIVLP